MVLAAIWTGSGHLAQEEAERSLAELGELAQAAGGMVVGEALQHRDSPDAALYTGKGKLQEIKDICQAENAGSIIFDDELSGSQIRNIENFTGVKVIDRTMLILDIFAGRAKSSEGKLQVELAQLQYRLSRLVGMGQALSRLGGGIGTRGPGETQLESDRRHINRRITHLKKALQTVSRQRTQTRLRRQSQDTMSLAVVGYTNAGKSTLINRLCATDLDTKDQVFATLDPSVRRMVLPEQGSILMVDTVGFIRKLPHNLVEAFQSTLEEVTEADAVIEVVDASDPDAATHMAVVENQLQELKAAGKERLLVFNKMDLVSRLEFEDPDKIDAEPPGLDPSLLKSGFNSKRQQAFLVSAVTGEGMEELRAAISELAAARQFAMKLLLPYDQAGLLDQIRQHGKLDDVEYRHDGILANIHIPYSQVGPLKKYIMKSD